MAQVVQHLSSKCGTLSSNSSTTKEKDSTGEIPDVYFNLEINVLEL
jgi:hypothetical protein